MVQSRLISTVAIRTCRAFSFAPSRRFATSTGRTADPAVFSEERDQKVQPAVPHGDPEERNFHGDHYEPDSQKPDREPVRKSETIINPPRKMNVSPQRLEKVEINNPSEPQIQQKRRNSTLTLEGVSCAGLDGSPWPKEERNNNKGEVESDKDYYSHHKASPLSEIEFADTRKPITRATDGTADSGGGGGYYRGGGDILVWRPEQLDTAEEALERGRRIFRENAMRGDPDSPHGRVLRQMRGEWF